MSLITCNSTGAVSSDSRIRHLFLPSVYSQRQSMNVAFVLLHCLEDNNRSQLTSSIKSRTLIKGTYRIFVDLATIKTVANRHLDAHWSPGRRECGGLLRLTVRSSCDINWASMWAKLIQVSDKYCSAPQVNIHVIDASSKHCFLL